MEDFIEINKRKIHTTHTKYTNYIVKKIKDMSNTVGFMDSRIQINLFATTNTFCYGINKQDIQYNYKTN